MAAPSTSPMVVGNKGEKALFSDVHEHYLLAKADLDQRLKSFDKKDELFRSYIDTKQWPYNSVLFDPRVFTFIIEKNARLFAKKPRGRLVAREGTDTIKARINQELLDFQWDDNSRAEDWPMLAKWAMMDLNARKYGASFALCKWRYEREVKRKSTDKGEQVKVDMASIPRFDGPDFKPLINRDCLPNPSYSTVKTWFQHRDYLTIGQLESTNDAARSKPIYKNLDLLKMQVEKANNNSGADLRSTNWQSRNKSITKVTDRLGLDPTNRTIEIVTEYRPERWITFAPRHGVVIRDIPNPYNHGQIPVVMLRYYPIDDDIYGLSEIEPIERLQKGINALMNQYVDTINQSLYAPLKIRANSVQMHTIEFGPGKKWIMNNPDDVVAHDQSPTGVTEFTSTYSFMVSALSNAVGETSQGISNVSPFQPDKTATEVQDTASQRLARDNMNQIYLSEAIKKQMILWLQMNQQFIFDRPDERQKILRIVGKDAIRFFSKLGLDATGNDDDTIKQLAAAGQVLPPNVRAEDFETPLFPVNVDGKEVPKMQVDEVGDTASIILEEEDLSGVFDYIPDVESMQIPDSNAINARKRQLMELSLNPNAQQQLQAEGFKIKFKDLMEDFFEDVGMTDAEKYFEKSNTGGDQGLQTGGIAGGDAGIQGVAGGPAPVAQVQGGELVPGPAAV